MGAGLLVGVWVARYLGPEQFGLLNYVTAFVALFGAIASLGLNGIVVRDLVKHPENANETLGTAFLLQFMGGLLAFALAVIAISFVRPDNDMAKWMVAVLGFVMVFKATDVVKYWFEAQVKSKYVVWIENGAFLLLAALKIGLILAHAPLMAFVWTAFAEGALVAAGFVIVYVRNCGKLSAWRIRYDRAVVLLKDSWPLVLSGLAVMLYMRIDQIMIGQMLGDKEVGLYTAAVRISEVWYFIPAAIVSSVFPSIIKAKGQAVDIYYLRLQKLFDIMIIISLMVSLLMVFWSKPLVVLLFGVGYEPAGAVLAIHIWGGVFMSIGLASGGWYLAENLQMLAFGRTLLGAFINISANFFFDSGFWDPRCSDRYFACSSSCCVSI